MALQLTQDNLRQIRYQLYQDQVFLVTHSALRILLRALDLVKLFVLAYKFTDGLLAHLPSEYDLMEYEVEDIFRELNEELVADGKADVADEDVAFDGRLLLILSLVKLHALRHTDPLAHFLSGIRGASGALGRIHRQGASAAGPRQTRLLEEAEENWCRASSGRWWGFSPSPLAFGGKRVRSLFRGKLQASHRRCHTAHPCTSDDDQRAVRKCFR